MAMAAMTAAHELLHKEEGQQTGQHVEAHDHRQVLFAFVVAMRVRMRMAAVLRVRVRVQSVRDEMKEHVRQESSHGEAEQHYFKQKPWCR